MRALAGALVSDVHDAISDLPGSVLVRAALVTKALEHLDACIASPVTTRS